MRSRTDGGVGPSADSRRWLAGATVVAAVATAGSLWFSLGLGLVPCELCWYQRILMYPLVVVLGVATLERRPGVWRTVLPLSTFGTLLALYHSFLQVTSVDCGFDGACAAVQWQSPLLGLSIPNLSFLGFLLVTAAAVWLSDVGR
ncbi:disulfide bond formation protein B [Candidatus Halobonum tyrrellensis]|uniref:Disulfide bond formation protein DsbB n=1 Tax=Candidatus Halobonum tyrrellensis G22 TaxID=1324957 RepID=V4H968_9EURY|nr:disulfide bond formation protein B [Candidatus Halobonum tyrrellensis]ESP87260.1 disulfide bond formation protein DsbB [Candidatus Halobonum tyrrellensis G22]